MEWENEDEYDIEEYTQQEMERIVYRPRPLHTRLASVDPDEGLSIREAMSINNERDRRYIESEVREESHDNEGMGMDSEYDSDDSHVTLCAEDDSDWD